MKITIMLLNFMLIIKAIMYIQFMIAFFHYFLKTSSRYNNKTGTELCNIAKNRSIVPNSKTKDIVEGNKQVTINQTQSDGSTKVITMNIPDGTAYETWIYK